MSVFKLCETCGQVAQAICECSSSPRFFCDHHSSDHRRSGGNHPFQEALLPLSSEQCSLLRQGFDEYQKRSIHEAILRRNRATEDLMRQIRKVDENCQREIESISQERSMIEEVCELRSLPATCENPLIASLVTLRDSSNFSDQEIQERFLSLRSFYSRWELLCQFQAHDEPIQSIAVSDCEGYFATGSRDNKIKIWDSESFECVYTLDGHTKCVNSLTFCGCKLISGSEDGTIKIWEGDACSDTLSLHSIYIKKHSVLIVCVSNSRVLLASGGNDKRVIVYHLVIKKTIQTLVSHSDCIVSVVFSPSDNEIVSGSADGSIKVWMAYTGELLKTLKGNNLPVTCVCFVGSCLVSSSRDRTIKIWDIENEEPTNILFGHSPNPVRVDGSEKGLCFLDQDHSIMVWDTISKECIQVFEGHGCYSQDDWRYQISLKFYRKGSRIISGGRDMKIKIFKKLINYT